MICMCVCVLQVLRAELELTRGRMEEVRALAQELMSTRGENCQAQVGPKVEQLNQRFDTIAQRVTSGLVGQITIIPSEYCYFKTAMTHTHTQAGGI